jgi:hypothetical protein
MPFMFENLEVYQKSVDLAQLPQLWENKKFLSPFVTYKRDFHAQNKGGPADRLL